jgi:hypothetical protein
VDVLDGRLEVILREPAKPYRDRLVELVGLIDKTPTGHKLLDSFRDLAMAGQRPRVDVRPARAAVEDTPENSRVLWLRPDILRTQAPEIGVSADEGHAALVLWDLAMVHNGLVSLISPNPEKLDPIALHMTFRREFTESIEAARFRSTSVSLGNTRTDDRRVSLPGTLPAGTARLSAGMEPVGAGPSEGKVIPLQGPRPSIETLSPTPQLFEPPDPHPYPPTVTPPQPNPGKWTRLSQFARRPLDWMMRGVESVGRLFTRSHSVIETKASASDKAVGDIAHSTSDDDPSYAAAAVSTSRRQRSQKHKRTQSVAGSVRLDPKVGPTGSPRAPLLQDIKK